MYWMLEKHNRDRVQLKERDLEPVYHEVVWTTQYRHTIIEPSIDALTHILAKVHVDYIDKVAENYILWQGNMPGW